MRLSTGQASGPGTAGWSEAKVRGVSWVSCSGAGTLLAAVCARVWGQRMLRPRGLRGGQGDRLSAAAGQLAVARGTGRQEAYLG